MAQLGKSRKPRWHYVYFALGALDLLTVGVGLGLSHTLSSSYKASVEDNRELAALQSRMNALAGMAQALNAPGNDVFDSRDVPTERARRDAARTIFQAHLASLASSIQADEGMRAIAGASEALEQTQREAAEMSSEADLIFRHFERGNAAAAGARMATMDRKYGELTSTIGAGIEAIQRHQLQQLDEQVARAQDLQSIERLIAALMMLMVGGVMFYGHQVSRLGARAMRNEDQLSEANQNLHAYQSVLDQHAKVAVTDAKGDVIFVNDLFCEVSGYSREELVGKNFRVLSSGHHSREFFAEMWRTIQAGETWRGEICNRARNGGLQWVDTTIVPLLGADGRPEKFVSVRYDITKRKATEAVAERRREVDALIGAMQAELIASGSMQVSLRHALAALLPMYGAGAGFVCELGLDQDELPFSALMTHALAYGSMARTAEGAPRLADVERLPEMIQECLGAGDLSADLRAAGLGYSTYFGVPISIGGAPVGLLGLAREESPNEALIEELRPVLAAIGELIVAQRDADRRREAEQTARELARRDALTGLGNRRSLAEEFEARVDHPQARFSLLLIDLDRFKPINDVHGHAVGDEVLQVVSQRLRGAVRGDCAIARLGGDEFAILTEPATSNAGVREVAERILTSLTGQIATSGGLALSVGASIGVAAYPDDAQTIQQLLHLADAAMYRAKESRGEVRFFDASMDYQIRRRGEIEAELRKAIEQDGIVPYFQPYVCLKTGQVTGHEVLARWRHPTLGMIPPTTFIPIAEEAGLIDELFWRLLRAACISHKQAGVETMLSVNIAPAQVKNPHLAQRIVQTLTELGFPSGRLEVEVTESSMLGDMERALPTLLSLRNQGIRIALDDFGTGYSSLLMLRDLPIHKVKIDRSFVQGLAAHAEANEAIIDAIFGMANALSLDVTAEGIESGDVAALLTQKGCHFGQGYFYGTPAPELKLISRDNANSGAARNQQVA